MATLLTLAALAQGVDAQALQSLDGGRYPAMMEPDIGLENTLAASLAIHSGADLAVLRTREGDSVLLERVTTQELSVSMNVFDAARIGIGLPRHRPVIFEGVREPDAVSGDFAFWVQGELAEGERFQSALSAQLDLPLGSNRLWLGEPDPALEVRTSNELVTGRLSTLVNVGLRLSRSVGVPGMRWGNHWVWGLGTRWEPYGPLGFTGELFGRTPLNPISGPAGAYPAELLVTVDGRLGPVTLGFGGGRGLTRGLGSPGLRVLGRVDVRPHRKRDRDGDGIGDLRDVCPNRPEDLDGFRDQDGCPDIDNDEDGVLDDRDACPNDPEVVNRWKDDDGCPDSHAMLEIVVLPTERPVATASWQGRTIDIPPERPAFVDVDAGSVEVEVFAEGFERGRAIELVGEGTEATVTVTLEQVPLTQLDLRFTDPAGISVSVTLDGTEVPATGLSEERPSGELSARVESPGFLPMQLELTLAPGAVEEVVVLQPATLDAGVAFEVDSAVLAPLAVDTLEAMRAYLDAHPEMKLVRVEGEADDAGTSAYNYALSTKRAEAVRDWLVAQGIDPERLVAIGSGEARDDERQVRFRVLIWD